MPAEGSDDPAAGFEAFEDLLIALVVAGEDREQFGAEGCGDDDVGELATLLCVVTGAYYVPDHVQAVGVGGVVLGFVPGLAAAGLFKLRYRDDLTYARGLLVLDALLTTFLVVGAPFTFYYFAPAALGLWVAVAAVTIGGSRHLP